MSWCLFICVSVYHQKTFFCPWELETFLSKSAFHILQKKLLGSGNLADFEKNVFFSYLEFSLGLCHHLHSMGDSVLDKILILILLQCIVFVFDFLISTIFSLTLVLLPPHIEVLVLKLVWNQHQQIFQKLID